MRLSDISMKIDNAVGRIKRRFSSAEDALDDMEEMYEESISSIDEIEDKLNYYKRRPEELRNEYTKEVTTYSIDERVDESTDLVKKIYGQYRKERPLLTGDEDYYDFRRPISGTKEEHERFRERAKEHIRFLSKVRSVLQDALEDVRKSEEKLEREKYKKKAAKDRDKSYDIDKDEIIPDSSPDKIRNELSDVLDDEIDEVTEEEEEEGKTTEDEMSLMTERQFIHYIIEYLKSSRGSRSDYYKTLNQGYPEQSEIIERNVHSVRSLDRLDYETEGIIKLNQDEIQYIQDRVRNNREPVLTMEEFREEYREKEMEL